MQYEQGQKKTLSGFESLQQRGWYRLLCYFYKTFKKQSRNYLFRVIPKQNTKYATGNPKDIPQCRTNHEYSLFSSCN